jgi:hypothetical protein
MTNIATPYGELLTSIHPKTTGIAQAFNAHRGFLTAGLVRRALGTSEIEITAGATAGATITLPTKANFTPGDWFKLSHTVNGSVAYWFTGVAEFAAGAMSVPAKANITNADYVYFTDPDGVITGIWFDTTGAETEPPALTAIVAAGEAGSQTLEAAIDAATTAASVMAIIETALNAAAIGITSNDAAADGTTVLTVAAAGVEGNDWDFTEAGSHAGFTVTDPTGGVDDLAEPSALMVDNSDYQIEVDLTTATSAEDVEALIIAAINTTQNQLIASTGDITISLNLPTAESGGTGVVKMLTGIISQRAVWTVSETVVSGTFALVQASTLDIKVNSVTISGGPFLYTTDDPGSVVVGIAAVNAAKAEHNYEAYQGTDSSHIGLSQRRGGLITGVLSVTVTGSAAVEGGGAVTDFSGDTDTLTEVVNGAAANLPTGTWEILANPALLEDYGTSLITHGYFACDVDIVIQRGRRRSSTGTAIAGKTFATANGEFNLPCIGLGKQDETGKLVSLGVWTVAGSGVLKYHFLHV